MRRKKTITLKPENIMDRSWTSLTQLKEHFEKTNEENVIDFNGVELKTEKYIYGLAFSELTRRNNERSKTKAK
jgi:hypothetical protein